MPDLFKVDDVTSSVNQHRVSNPQQPQFPVSANIPAPMGVPPSSVNQHRVSNPQQPQFPVSANIPAPMGVPHVWHGVAGCSENCFSAKNAKEMM